MENLYSMANEAATWVERKLAGGGSISYNELSKLIHDYLQKAYDIGHEDASRDIYEIAEARIDVVEVIAWVKAGEWPVHVTLIASDLHDRKALLRAIQSAFAEEVRSAPVEEFGATASFSVEPVMEAVWGRPATKEEITRIQAMLGVREEG